MYMACWEMNIEGGCTTPTSASRKLKPVQHEKVCIEKVLERDQGDEDCYHRYITSACSGCVVRIPAINHL